MRSPAASTEAAGQPGEAGRRACGRAARAGTRIRSESIPGRGGGRLQFPHSRLHCPLGGRTQPRTLLAGRAPAPASRVQLLSPAGQGSPPAPREPAMHSCRPLSGAQPAPAAPMRCTRTEGPCRPSGRGHDAGNGLEITAGGPDRRMWLRAASRALGGRRNQARSAAQASNSLANNDCSGAGRGGAWRSCGWPGRAACVALRRLHASRARRGAHAHAQAPSPKTRLRGAALNAQHSHYHGCSGWRHPGAGAGWRRPPRRGPGGGVTCMLCVDRPSIARTPGQTPQAGSRCRRKEH